MSQKRNWTPEELRKMWLLKNSGMTNREIHNHIGRSPAAISAMIRQTHDYMGDWPRTVACWILSRQNFK